MGKIMIKRYEKVHQYFRKCKDEQVDINKEELINALLCELMCERRKIIEIINAVITKYPYKEEKVNNKRVLVLQNE